MERIKTLVNILTISFSISFFDGMFEFGFSDNFYVVVGLVMMVGIIWLQVDVRKVMKK